MSIQFSMSGQERTHTHTSACDKIRQTDTCGGGRLIHSHGLFTHYLIFIGLNHDMLNNAY
jgi:hypothetical protein